MKYHFTAGFKRRLCLTELKSEADETNY